MKELTLFESSPQKERKRLKDGKFCTPKQKDLDERISNLRKVENENSWLKRQREADRRKIESLLNLNSGINNLIHQP